MPHLLESKLAAAWPLSDWDDVTVVVAVSGGCDSVALLRAMLALKSGGAGRLWAAHLNHQLRPDADEDERFVVELCQRLGVTCEVGRVAVDQFGGALRRWAGSRRPHCAIPLSARNRRPARRTLRGHRPHGRRPGRNHFAPHHSRDGHSRLGRHAAGRPLGHATLIRPLLGVRRDELQRLSRRAGPALPPRPEQRRPPLYPQPHPPPDHAAVAPAFQYRSNRGPAPARRTGRRGPSRCGRVWWPSGSIDA